ncbi:MAG TPA: hypothetical protein VL122_13690 [Nitrospirota bacterium]|jgi:hypothetical protein|nr:hypothetical protein [Nitrospirota bacterium]
MADRAEERAATGGWSQCLDISVQPVTSQLRANDGREIPFTKAILMLRNVCKAEVVNVVPHATLSQEGGTIQDVTISLSHSAPSSIPSGGTISWDVYDLLLPAHPGTASKIHMFGYRAVLNWRFDLEVWAQYRRSVTSEPLKTPLLRWSFRWTVEDPSTGAVGLNVEEIKD